MRLASQRNEIKWGNERLKGQGNPNFSGGKYLDDKGYMRVLRPDHPHHNRGYVYEHRLVMEKHLGRFISPEEVIHHINEIKIDNRIENLYLCSKEQHSALHRHGKSKSLKERANLRTKAKERMRTGRSADRVRGKFEKTP